MKINTSILKKRSQSITLNGICFNYSSAVPPNGLVYTNHKEDEAILTVRNESVFGSIKTHDGGSFAIEQCHNNHILKVFNVKLFPDEECFHIESKSMIEDSKTKSVSDNKTIVTYSVMIYYTLQVIKAVSLILFRFQ